MRIFNPSPFSCLVTSLFSGNFGENKYTNKYRKIPLEQKTLKSIPGGISIQIGCPPCAAKYCGYRVYFEEGTGIHVYHDYGSLDDEDVCLPSLGCVSTSCLRSPGINHHCHFLAELCERDFYHEKGDF